VRSQARTTCGSLNNLSNRLGDPGRREEGLAAITEAVDIRRRLTEQPPMSMAPSWNSLDV
jgi:hypothetical protein